MTNNIKGNRGFTLIELMVTLGVSAMILGFGVPGFQGMIRDNRLVSQYNQYISSLNIARSEAVKRGAGITICKSNAAGNDCNNAGNWEDGWIVFDDLDNDSTVDANEIIKFHQALNGNTTLRAALALGQNRITYNSQGFAIGFNGTFRFCDARGVRSARGLIISPNGRAKRALDTDADGIVEDGSGNPIACP